MFLICAAVLCSNTVLAQNPSQNQQQGQQNNNWQYMGKVPITKTIGSDYNTFNTFGMLYSQFDGEKMVYKVYVAEDNEAYEVHFNPSYNQSKVEYAREMNNKYDNWKGPHPSVKEYSPQKAGPWYLNVSNVF